MRSVLASGGIVVALLAMLAVMGCEESRRRGGPPGQVTPCQDGATRCSGDVVQACVGGAFVARDMCADMGLTCAADGAEARCVSDRCETGTTGGRCNDGSSCRAGADCVSGACSAVGRCVPTGCANDVQDPGETAPDCGGPCPLCFGDPCSDDGQCISNYCVMGACAEPSCTDSTKNGGESDVDCGGADCPACAEGQGCWVPEDCSSRLCTDGSCAPLPPDCTDGTKNGEETDADCGGPSCPACALGKDCGVDQDCLSAFCNFGRCDRATCSDQIQNQGESDVDCGGRNCAPCADGAMCTAPGDCGAARCEGGVCTSCADGVQNGAETGPDCGGPCPACDDGRACTDPSACSSGRCEDGQCASCTDRIRTGAESDVDCGGPCDPCGNGAMCNGATDCASNRCESGTCCQPNACGVCGPTPREMCNGQDDDCDNQTDEGLTGSACPEQRGVCRGSTARCAGTAGWLCDDATYLAHDPAYSPTEAPCDGVDNDCNGQVDEVSCVPDNTVCTQDVCNNQQTCGVPLSGNECWAESPFMGDRSAMFMCLTGTCTELQFYLTCYPNGGGGCNSWLWTGSAIDIGIASSPSCTTATQLRYYDSDLRMTMMRSCPRGCFRYNDGNGRIHYTCF